MSQIIKTVCDGCGTAKRESNDWLKLYFWDRDFATFDEAGNSDEEKDFCGEKCFMSEIARLISERRKNHDMQ